MWMPSPSAFAWWNLIELQLINLSKYSVMLLSENGLRECMRWWIYYIMQTQQRHIHIRVLGVIIIIIVIHTNHTISKRCALAYNYETWSHNPEHTHTHIPHTASVRSGAQRELIDVSAICNLQSARLTTHRRRCVCVWVCVCSCENMQRLST